MVTEELSQPNIGWQLPTLALLQTSSNSLLLERNETASLPTNPSTTVATTNQPGLELEDESALIEQTLKRLGVEVTVREVNVGPTITQYALQPGPKIKVKRIAELADDLALALAVPSVRLELPVPGKSLVGLEVPNRNRRTVSLVEVMASPAFEVFKGQLKLALGRAVDGQPVVADLATMPHLLIGGSTGAGKSVFLNSLIAALLLQYGPDELQLVMIDPKLVELTPYNGIPHLLFPVITKISPTPQIASSSPAAAAAAVSNYHNNSGGGSGSSASGSNSADDVDDATTGSSGSSPLQLDAVSVLGWALGELERRKQLLAQTRQRNIQSYNNSNNNPSHRLPYLVIIIDELANLMLSVPRETEIAIVRLAQEARAFGIHLVVATQRPSVDIVTGLIKANLPTRVAFAVSSQGDSRVILDSVGAEKLLGRGDMLYDNASSGSKPRRVQGVYVSDNELDRLIEWWQNQNQNQNRTAGLETTPILPVVGTDSFLTPPIPIPISIPVPAVQPRAGRGTTANPGAGAGRYRNGSNNNKSPTLVVISNPTTVPIPTTTISSAAIPISSSLNAPKLELQVQETTAVSVDDDSSLHPMSVETPTPAEAPVVDTKSDHAEIKHLYGIVEQLQHLTVTQGQQIEELRTMLSQMHALMLTTTTTNQPNPNDTSGEVVTTPTNKSPDSVPPANQPGPVASLHLDTLHVNRLVTNQSHPTQPSLPQVEVEVVAANTKPVKPEVPQLPPTSPIKLATATNADPSHSPNTYTTDQEKRRGKENENEQAQVPTKGQLQPHLGQVTSTSISTSKGSVAAAVPTKAMSDSTSSLTAPTSSPLAVELQLPPPLRKTLSVGEERSLKRVLARLSQMPRRDLEILNFLAEREEAGLKVSLSKLAAYLGYKAHSLFAHPPIGLIEMGFLTRSAQNREALYWSTLGKFASEMFPGVESAVIIQAIHDVLASRLK